MKNVELLLTQRLDNLREPRDLEDPHLPRLRGCTDRVEHALHLKLHIQRRIPGGSLIWRRDRRQDP